MSAQETPDNIENPLQNSAAKLEEFAAHVETQIALHGHSAFTADQWSRIRDVLQSSQELLGKMEMLQARRMIESCSSGDQPV